MIKYEYIETRIEDTQARIMISLGTGDKTVGMLVNEVGARERTVRYWLARFRYTGTVVSVWKIENNKRVIYYRRCCHEEPA